MNRSTSLVSFVLASLVGVGLSACSSAPPDARGEPVARTSEGLSTSDVIARAQLWVTAMVPYCQSPNGQPDPDTSCSPTCERPGEPAAWDPYRSDCSGFVSWAWGLPAPGLDTSEFVPGQNSVPTMEIDGTTMQPGDACNIGGDHIVLFVNWIVPGQEAAFMEEPGCSANPPYAHSFTSNVEISGSQVTIDYEGSTFTAIRNPNLVASDGGTITIGSDAGSYGSCTVGSMTGECISTTQCSGMAGYMSTPGYCPGPTDIQCCTGSPPPDSGSASSGSSSGGSGGSSGSGSGAGSSSGGSSSSGSGGSSSSGSGSTSSGSSSGGAVSSSSSGGSGSAPESDAGDGQGSTGEGDTNLDPSHGCTTAPGRGGGSPALLGVGLAWAVASRRRRSRSAR
jgi:uncharacterized membrane protein YgcG